MTTTPHTTSIHLSWTQRDDDYIESFEITYSYQGPCVPAPSNMTLQDIITRVYNVTELEEFSNYSIIIAAVNSAGRRQATIAAKTVPKGNK